MGKNVKKTKNSAIDEEIKSKPNSGKTPRGRGGNGRKSNAPSKSDGKFACSLGKPTNDPRWYLNNPVLARDIASIWFSKPTGAYLPPTCIVNGGTATLQNDQREPGIWALPSVTTWGGNVMNSSRDFSNDPINLTAQKLYQFVVHANSRNISYDKKDLMMTIMAIDGVYQFITEAIRAYRLTAQYDPQNKYVTHLLTTMNWNAADLRHNVAQFRYYINWAITRVNKFFVPAIFSIIPAHMSCYEHIYADRPSEKAQLIVKFSAGFWMYSDTNGALDYYRTYTCSDGTIVDWSFPHTVDEFASVVNDMIANIENAQYLGVMQGDLLKAFGIERMAQYAYLNIDMPIAPVYDEEFLLKFHNADISQAISENTNGSLMVYRDDDNATGNMLMMSKSLIGIADLKVWRQKYGMMVDLPTHIPADASTVLLMSLYKLLGSTLVTKKWHLADASGVPAYMGQVPPEILLGGAIYTDPEDLSQKVSTHTWLSCYTGNRAGFLSRFETTPLITDKITTDGNQTAFFWKTDNVTDVSYEMVRRMFEVIYWSLWASNEISTDVSRETRV